VTVTSELRRPRSIRSTRSWPCWIVHDPGTSVAAVQVTPLGCGPNRRVSARLANVASLARPRAACSAWWRTSSSNENRW